MLNYQHDTPQTKLMLILLLLLSLGFIALIWGANQLVSGAVNIALLFKIPTLIVGLTIVSLITSAPELMVSIIAAMNDSTGLAVGNIIGSNIANIGLVLGVTALITPLKFEAINVRREFPMLLLATLIVGILLADLYLSRYDGILMLTTLVFIGYLLYKSHKASDFIDTPEADITPSGSTIKSLIQLIIGVVVLIVGARIIVYAALELAQLLSISEVIIGLTITAIGTSLPELASCVISAVRKQHALAIGSILGSNIMNLLLITAFPGLIHPSIISSTLFFRDYGFMTFMTLILFVLTWFYRDKLALRRSTGILLLSLYITYMLLLYWTGFSG